MLRRSLALIAALAMLLALPLNVGAGSKAGHGEGTWQLPDGTTVVLSKVSPTDGQVTILAQGYWDAGCRYTAYGPGGTIYSYTIWQHFGSNGSYINSFPAPTYSATTDVGYQLTKESHSHWWINTSHKDAAAQGNYTFTQYISGQPFRSYSGWVRVQIRYTGTWSCYSS